MDRTEELKQALNSLIKDLAGKIATNIVDGQTVLGHSVSLIQALGVLGFIADLEKNGMKIVQEQKEVQNGSTDLAN